MTTAPVDHGHPPPNPPQDSTAEARSLPMLLPVFLLFFFLIGFFSIYLLHYLSYTWFSRLLRNNSSAAGRQPPRADRGLDPAILEGFPTFPYEAVRGLREGKCGLECAVCLSEFAAGDVVRLLTVCCHAFHPACIDEWLASQTTCPVCRSDLEAQPDAATVLAVQRAVGGGGGGGGSKDNHTINVDVDEEEGVSKQHSRGQSMVIGRREIVTETEDDDRFTLRLTEAAEEQIAVYHMRVASR